MKIFNLYWNSNYKYYYYTEDNGTIIYESIEKNKKNEPAKKFNRWLDKFLAIQNENIDKSIFDLIYSKFDNINNINPNMIKNILKIYNLNKYYKMIPSIYCKILGYRFYINEEMKLNIKKIYCKFINTSSTNICINYYFFIKAILNYHNEELIAKSIPCINSLDKNYDYIMFWNDIKSQI